MQDGVTLRALPENERPYGALTAYEVLRDGVVVGIVSKHKTTSYRKAGRLIAETFHPLRWATSAPGEYVSLRSAYLHSRAEAIDRLLR